MEGDILSLHAAAGNAALHTQALTCVWVRKPMCRFYILRITRPVLGKLPLGRASGPDAACDTVTVELQCLMMHGQSGLLAYIGLCLESKPTVLLPEMLPSPFHLVGTFSSSPLSGNSRTAAVSGWDRPKEQFGHSATKEGR